MLHSNQVSQSSLHQIPFKWYKLIFVPLEWIVLLADESVFDWAIDVLQCDVPLKRNNEVFKQMIFDQMIPSEIKFLESSNSYYPKYWLQNLDSL